MTRRFLILAVAFGLLLPLALVAAPIGSIPDLRIGESVESVTGKCAGLKGNSESLSVETPQHFSQGLLRSGLLALLNRAKARHSLLDNPAARRVSFRRTETPGHHRYLFAFAEGKLEAALLKTPVTISGDRHDPARLGPIRAILQPYQSACALAPVYPRARNHFEFAGDCGGGTKVYVEYRPERDEAWILLHR